MLGLPLRQPQTVPQPLWGPGVLPRRTERHPPGCSEGSRRWGVSPRPRTEPGPKHPNYYNHTQAGHTRRTTQLPCLSYSKRSLPARSLRSKDQADSALRPLARLSQCPCSVWHWLLSRTVKGGLVADFPTALLWGWGHSPNTVRFYAS